MEGNGFVAPDPKKNRIDSSIVVCSDDISLFELFEQFILVCCCVLLIDGARILPRTAKPPSDKKTQKLIIDNVGITTNLSLQITTTLFCSGCRSTILLSASIYNIRESDLNNRNELVAWGRQVPPLDCKKTMYGVKFIDEISEVETENKIVFD